MGKIADAFKDAGLSIAKRKQVLRLDAEFSAQATQIQALKDENLHLRAVVNPLRRELEAEKKKNALLNAPPHPDASSPEHKSRNQRPQVLFGQRRPLTGR